MLLCATSNRTRITDISQRMRLSAALVLFLRRFGGDSVNKKLRAFLANATLLSRTGFLHVFGSGTINQIVNFAYGILIVRVVSKEEYGVFGYASNLFNMLMLLSGFGIVSGVLQIASEQGDDRRKAERLLQYGYRFGTAFNVVISVVMLLVALLIPLPINGSNVTLGMMFLLPVPMILRDLQIVWLRATMQNKAYGVVNSTSALLISALTILGAWILRLRGIIFGQYIAVIAMLVLLWTRYAVPFPAKGSPIPASDRRDLLRIAGISALNNALSQLLALLGTFILGLVASDANTIAAYKVGSTIPFALSFIPAALMTYAYPYFARHKNDRGWTISKYRMLMLGAGSGNLLISVAGILLAVPIVRIIFGAQYSDAVPPFRIMMLGYFFSSTFAGIPGNLLVTQRKLKVNLYRGILVAIANLGMNLVLIPAYGSVGAAVANLMSAILSGTISTIVYGIVIHRLREGETC